MIKLSQSELREFGIRGYVIVRDVIPPAILAAASKAIDDLVDEQPPPDGYVGRRVGHEQRWRQCLCDVLLEFDPVRAALDRETP